MNKYKVIYRTNEGSRIFKVLATDKKMAYEKFRKVVSTTAKVTNIIKVEETKNNKSVIMLVAILLVTLSLGIFIGVSFANSVPNFTSFSKYTVHRGDTVWEIAELSDGWDKIDARFIVDDIMKLSNCSENIHPGQTVYIPMYFN